MKYLAQKKIAFISLFGFLLNLKPQELGNVLNDFHKYIISKGILYTLDDTKISKIITILIRLLSKSNLYYGLKRGLFCAFVV